MSMVSLGFSECATTDTDVLHEAMAGHWPLLSLCGPLGKRIYIHKADTVAWLLSTLRELHSGTCVRVLLDPVASTANIVDLEELVVK